MRAILWDLDDTLLNTIDHRMRALAHAYACCVGGSVDPVALWRSQHGRTLEDLGRRLLGDGYLRFTGAYRDFYYASKSRVRPYDEIPETLAWCRASGLVLAVVTSKVSWGATDELARAGLLEHFHAVVAYDDTDAHKPDPEPVHEALDRLMIDHPADALFVGDSPADILAARNAGCRSVAALWGTLDAELLRDAAPDDIAARPLDVVALLAAEAAA